MYNWGLGPKIKRLGKEKFEVGKGWVGKIKQGKCCFNIYIPGQKYFVRLIFFEVITIIQIFLRGLDKLNFDP